VWKVKIWVNRDSETVWEDVRTRLFLWTGQEPKIIERDGDTVIYKCPDRGVDCITEVGEDVYTLSGIQRLEPALRAIRAWGGWHSRYRNETPKVGIVAGDHCFVWLHDQLCIRYFKRRGRVPHYAPVTMEEAREVADGQKKLMYWTNSNRFELVAK